MKTILSYILLTLFVSAMLLYFATKIFAIGINWMAGCFINAAAELQYFNNDILMKGGK